MIIMVDIDGVICNNTWGEYKKAKPFKENIEKINKLYDEGNRIILWTTRGVITGIDWEKLTKQQMKEWNVKYHELKLDKPYYDLFIDDRTKRIDEI